MPKKTMIVEKTHGEQSKVNVKGQQLTQVKQYKYLRTTVEHTGQCKTEVAQRINQVKIDSNFFTYFGAISLKLLRRFHLLTTDLDHALVVCIWSSQRQPMRDQDL